MKLTDQDIEMFKALKTSGMGKQLSDYCDRLIDHAHNSRHWKEGDSRESAEKAGKIIQENLIDKIKLQHEFKHINVNQHE